MIIDQFTPVQQTMTTVTNGYKPGQVVIPAELVNNVDHPVHYKGDKFECIDVMEEVYGKEAVQHFCILNAFKYIYRQNKKNGSEDVRKAIWYLNKYLELEGKAG